MNQMEYQGLVDSSNRALDKEEIQKRIDEYNSKYKLKYTIPRIPKSIKKKSRKNKYDSSKRYI